MAMLKVALLFSSLLAISAQELRGAETSVTTRTLKNRYYIADRAERDQDQDRYYDNARYEEPRNDEYHMQRVARSGTTNYVSASVEGLDDSQRRPGNDVTIPYHPVWGDRTREYSDAEAEAEVADRQRTWAESDRQRYYDDQQQYDQQRYDQQRYDEQQYYTRQQYNDQQRYYDEQRYNEQQRYYDGQNYERNFDGQEQQDVPYTAFADGLPLATGYKKKSKDITVKVGYSNSAKYKVAKGGDALTALNQAMKDVTAAKGGVIDIEAGEYILSTQYIMTCNNTWLKGAGQDKTILKLTNKARRFRYAGFLRGTYVRDITISDLTLDGNRKGQSSDLGDEKENYGRYGFYMDGYTNLLMTRMTIQNFQAYGFDPHGIKPNPTIFSTRLTITNCISRGNGWDGFTLDQTTGVYVENCLAENNGRHGFNVVTGSKNVVVKNCVANNNGFGRRLYKSGNGCGYVANDDNFGLNTGDVLFLNNKAKNSFKGGVCLLEPVNVVIEGNTFDTAPACGHFAGSRLSKVTWRNNVCINTKQTAFINKDVKAGAISGIPKDMSRDWQYMG